MPPSWLPMKFAHSEEKRDGRDVDVLIDEENGFRIVVSRLGAELISVARINEAGKWTGFLYRDDDLSSPPQGWANHSTVMGYYLHRLKNGRSLYRGREIKGGNHSQFGHYGHQLFDGKATISREAQQAATRTALLEALSEAGK